MSNKAITKNDLAAVLNEVLPPTPSEYRKLLWTNPNSGDPFSAQTISIDLSEYDAIEVVAQHWSNNGTTASMVAKVGEIGVTTVPNYDNSTIAIRSFTVSTSGVQFTDGRNVTGSSISTNSHASIPRRIYGIKYERVAPPQVEYPNYSTEEQEVGTFIDGKTIYRKSKLYTWSGTTTYDNDFFSGISVDRIVRQRTQITKNANYAQESFYWSNTDYNRCWISLTNTPPVVAFACSQSAGCEILITVDYTKA